MLACEAVPFAEAVGEVKEVEVIAPMGEGEESLSYVLSEVDVDPEGRPTTSMRGGLGAAGSTYRRCC